LELATKELGTVGDLSERREALEGFKRAVEDARAELRQDNAGKRLSELDERIAETEAALTAATSAPDEIAGRREKLAGSIEDAEGRRNKAADALAEAEVRGHGPRRWLRLVLPKQQLRLCVLKKT